MASRSAAWRRWVRDGKICTHRKDYLIAGIYLFGELCKNTQIAEFLQQLLEKHPTETIYVAWDNASTHQDDEVEAVVRAAAGRLILLYLPTYSPWLNPIEMLWRHLRREVTHCELFDSVKSLIAATLDFFDRYNRLPNKTLSIIGAIP
jgi:transposase